MVSAVIGLVILPWNLYNSPAVIVYFLGGLGALLGPLFGVIIADYWLLRRTKVNVPALYTEDPDGIYFYRNGFNPRAIAAFVPAAVISLVIAFTPPCMPSPRSHGSSAQASARSCISSWRIGPKRSRMSQVSRSPFPACTEHVPAVTLFRRASTCASLS